MAMAPNSPTPPTVPNVGSMCESQVIHEGLLRTLPDSLGGLINRLGQELTCPICRPTVTPCQHSFCAECIERMLRVGQSTDGSCPICKLRVSRRSVRPSPVLQSATEAFGTLASAFESVSGSTWEASRESIGAACDTMRVKRRRPENAKTESVADKDEKPVAVYSDAELLPDNLPELIAAKENTPRPVAAQVLCFTRTRSRVNVAEVCKRLGLRHSVSDAFVPNVTTHLLVGTVPPPTLDDCSPSDMPRYVAAGRTLKYLQALLCGAWIVADSWIHDSSAAGRLLDPAPYELSGDESFPDEAAPQRARISGAGRLFKDMVFALDKSLAAKSATSPLRAQEIEGLIALGGGRVLPRRASADDALWLYADGAVRPDSRDCAPLSWFMACISAFQILDRNQPPYRH